MREGENMKYYFIINPVSGPMNQTKKLSEEIAYTFKKYPQHDFEIYETKFAGDGERFVKEKSTFLQEPTVFLACGGDGTSYEVLNGIVDFEKSILGVISVGSCNDFLKNYSGVDFRTIEKIIDVEPKKIDIINCNNRYALNEVNMGFDAMVNDDCNRIKAKTKNVKSAYNRAIVKNIILKKVPYTKVKIDNEAFYEGKMLLMTYANGRYYGGGYQAAPKAIVDDGKLEALVVKNVSRIRFVTLIKDYKRGTHLDKEKFKKYICYKKCENIKIEFLKEVCICLDGEITYTKNVDIKIEPSKLNFIVPGE